jgi:signal transduction histidine kinase
VVYRDVRRIGLQAISNAYQHAAASTITVAIDYGSAFFSVIVEDNGVGIDAAAANAGGRGI